MTTDPSWESTPGGDVKPSAGFFSQAQLAVRKGAKQRFFWATLGTLLGLALLILLGPDQQSIKDKFEYYGAPGELRIMPEISIEQGDDKTHQLPRSLRQPPPPTVVEVPEEKSSPTGFEPVPKPQESVTREPRVDQTADFSDAEASDRNQVELSLPQQSNPDWYILSLPRPEYPLDASPQERKTPIIFVEIAVFLTADGKVSHWMINGTNGSQVYTDAVLAVVDSWQFAWRVPQTSGRWIKLLWNFRSPFYAGNRDEWGS